MESPVIVGEHPIIRKVAGLAERLAATRHPVLIAGERGTGRSLVASVLHLSGPRAAAPFVTIDCRAAARARSPRCAATLVAAAESARGGTLFLEDVEWIEDAAQRALLAALAEGPRLVMSCAVAPSRGAQQELFPVLAQRTAALELFLPPLRERRRDIRALSEHFIDQWRAAAGSRVGADEAALLALWRYDWPGNVRQLKEELERALERSPGGFLRPEDLMGGVRGTGPGAGAPRRFAAARIPFAPASWRHLCAG